MEKSKFIKRALTSLVLASLTLLVLWAGVPYVNMMALLFGGALAWEWANMVPSRNKSAFAALYVIPMTVIACSTISFTLIWATLLVATLIAFFLSKGEKNRVLLALGVPYVTIGIGSIVWFYYFMGPLLLLWLIAAVWGMDIGGYVVGCSVKGPKLAPKISPHKTWSGLSGGIALAVALSLLFAWYTTGEYWLFAIYAVVAAVLAQIGDLIESAIKRRVDVKDSSSLIPGHGGVFDRIDGLLFAAPVIMGILAVMSFFG